MHIWDIKQKVAKRHDNLHLEERDRSVNSFEWREYSSIVQKKMVTCSEGQNAYVSHAVL